MSATAGVNLKAEDMAQWERLYKETLYEVFAGIQPFTAEETDDVYRILTDGRAGPRDLAHGIDEAYARFFADRDCTWQELIYWERLCEERGLGTFPQKKRPAREPRKRLWLLIAVTIANRAQERYTLWRCEHLLRHEGVFLSVMPDSPQVEPLIAVALELNPHAIPPFFPGDMSTLRLALPSFTSSYKDLEKSTFKVTLPV